jgi:predicted nucleotidyltransferase
MLAQFQPLLYAVQSRVDPVEARVPMHKYDGPEHVEFDASRSDADFLVTFTPDARNDLAAFADLKEALENLLGRSVDLVEREAVEASRNFIRRRAILREAETVYG